MLNKWKRYAEVYKTFQTNVFILNNFYYKNTNDFSKLFEIMG